MRSKFVVSSLLGLSLIGIAHAQILFSNNFDSFADGTDASTIPGITADVSAGYSFTVTNSQSVSPNNSLRITSAGGGEPSIFFALSSPITKDTTAVTISFDFTRGSDFDPQIWMMFGGASAGFAKGNVGIRNNGFNNIFDAVPDPGFLYTGNNTLIWQNLSVTYSNFTTDGTNITGWDASLVTSGVGTENNPFATWSVTGQSISQIDSIRFQIRGAAGDTYFDNVTITAVPEPSTVALALVGAAMGMVFCRRSTRRLTA